jgi:LacI family transcriptional regulator
VSKVLRNAYGVSDALRARVNTSIEKLGYRPSKAAQGLRGRSTTVGVLLVEIANPFLPQVIDGIQDTLARSHYRAMIGVGRAQTHLETELIESMIDHGMAGVILVAPLLPRQTVALYSQKIPTVLIAYHEPGAALFDTVNGDDHKGAAIATRALIERGYSDIGFLAHVASGGQKPDVVRLREKGYADTMALAGLPSRVIDLTSSQDERAAELSAVLARPDRPRAVVCWSDLDGIPLRALAAQTGLRIPGELAIVAYDNSPMTASPAFNLSSIDQSGRDLGRQAAEVLLSRIGGRREAQHLLLEPQLVVRPSI